MTETPVGHLVARLEKLRATDRRPQWTAADEAALAHVLGNYDGPAGDPKLLQRASRPPRPVTPERSAERRLRRMLDRSAAAAAQEEPA